MDISVVIPVKNRPVVLKRAVESAQGQTYKPSEIIIVDDGSTDETLEVARQLAKDDRSIRIIVRNTSGGAARARNDGVAAAQCVLVAFLDSDDVWVSTKLAAQVALLEKFPDAPAVSCGITYRYVNRGVEVRRPAKPVATTEKLMCENVIGSTSCIVVRRECFNAVNGFDEELPNCEDWDLWIRLSHLGALRGVQQELLIYTFDGSEKLSRNYAKLINGHKLMQERILASIEGQSNYAFVASMLEMKMAEINVRITGNRVAALRHFWRALSYRATPDIFAKITKISAISLMKGNRS